MRAKLPKIVRENQSVFIFFLSFFLGYIIANSIFRHKNTYPKSKKSFMQINDNPEYVVLGTMRCPYTVKQVDAFKNSQLPYRFEDTSTAEGTQRLQQITKGEQTGVPVTYNPSTDKFKVGFVPCDQLVSMLS
jgi:glutaredoxin